MRFFKSDLYYSAQMAINFSRTYCGAELLVFHPYIQATLYLFPPLAAISQSCSVKQFLIHKIFAVTVIFVFNHQNKYFIPKANNLIYGK